MRRCAFGQKLWQIVILATIHGAGARAFAAGTPDAYCEQFYADLVKGTRSSAYTWHSDLAPPRGPHPGPPSEDPAITRIFPSRAPVPIRHTPPDAAEFRRAFPHDLSDLRHEQTVIHHTDGNQYLVREFDPVKRSVLLEREVLRVEAASPRVSAPGLQDGYTVRDLLRSGEPAVRGEPVPPAILIDGVAHRLDREASGPPARWVFVRVQDESRRELSVQMTSELYLPRTDRPFAELRPGDFVTPQGGSTVYEVRALGDHDQAKALLRRVEQVWVNWEDFYSLAKQGPRMSTHQPSPAFTAIPESSASNRGLFQWLKRRSASTQESAGDVPLVRPGDVSVLGRTKDWSEDLTFTRRSVELDAWLRDLRRLGASGAQVEIHFHSAPKVSGAFDSPEVMRIWRELEIADLPSLVDLAEVRIRRADGRLLRVTHEIVPDERGIGRDRFYDASAQPAVTVRYAVSRPDPGEIVRRKEIAVQFAPGTPEQNQEMETLARELIKHLPVAQRDATGLVLIERGSFYRRDRVAGVARSDQARTIALFLNPRIEQKFSGVEGKIRVLWHEVGHQIALKLWRNNHAPSAEWTRAVTLDARSVSGYALHDHEMAEDFAETVAAYLATDGGRLKPALREAFAHRFAVLDRIFANPRHQREVRESLSRRAEAQGLRVAAVTLGTGATAYLIREGSKPRQDAQP